MKRAVLITVCLLMLTLLCGCKAKEKNNLKITNNKKVTFINEVTDADVWILPETEKNLKTTVWGTATASKVKTGESRQVPLCEPGDEGFYMLRMIDADSIFYSADGITLEAGWTIQIKGSNLYSVIVEVSDENGTLKNTYEVFAASL